MTWRLFGLRLMPLVALLWGLPSEAKAEISRQVVFDRGAEKIEAIEPQLFRSVKPPLMTQTAAVKQNDIEQDVLFNVEGTLAEGDVRFEDGSLHDVHAFEGQADQLVRITLTSDEFDTFLILQDALGEELARNDDGSNGTNAEIIFRLPTAQQYLIVANAYDETGKGAYRLIVERADETALSDEVALSDETALSDVPQKTEADHLLQRGNEAFRSSQYQTALSSWQSALEIYVEIGDRQGEANALGSLGIAYESLGDYERAIDFQQQSLAIFREIGNRQGEAALLGSLGIAYESLGDYERAIDFQQQSLAIFREIGNRQGEASALGSMGSTYISLGDYERAIDFQQQSLAIKREIGNRQGETVSLGNLGNAYFSLGDYERAIDFQQQSLAIARELSDRQGKANALGNLGNAYEGLGDYQRAIDFHQQSLAIFREIGVRQGEASMLGNLGSTYISLGDYERAIDFHQQSLVIKREIGNRQGEAISLTNLGNVYESLDDYERAIDFHQQSLAIFREIGARQGEAASLGNLGLAYYSLGDYGRAIDFHQQSLAIKRELGDRQGKADSLGNLGNAYFSSGDYERAKGFHQQSLAIFRELGDRLGEAIALGNAGTVYVQQGKIKQAETALFESIDIYENLRAAELTDQSRISFFETQISAYKKLEQVLILQNKFETALEISERGRTRSFVQLLSERLSSNPENQELTKSPSFSEIQRIAREQQSTLVEYSFSVNPSGDGLSLYIWLVQPTGKLHFKEVPIGESLTEISELVIQSREAMDVSGRGGLELSAATGAESDATAQLSQLHQLLIAPIADWLPDDPTQRVVFIPQGDLFLVPFPALQDESGTYLIERHTIQTAPSIQTLDLTRRRSSTTANRLDDKANILAVGNPVMPEVWASDRDTFRQLSSLVGAEQEAKTIANFFGVEALIGAQATEQAVKQQIETADIVHLATHGLLEYGIPEESGVSDIPGAIALTPTENEDGLLTATEIIEELNLQADLVVLSACDTGLGRVTGDGVIGLSRSLIAAGTPSVIVSLWSIPDAPTAELMVDFYQQRQQGKDKAQALRQAMLITMETHPNPRDWAAFTLIGEAD